MNIVYPKAEEEKKQYQERYELAAGRVREVYEELKNGRAVVPEYTGDYFEKVSGYLVMLMETYESVTDGTLYTKSLEELQEQNHALYGDLLPENYGESYANPAYAVKVLGEEYGRYLCLLYAELRETLVWVFEQRLFFLVTGTGVIHRDLRSDGG